MALKCLGIGLWQTERGAEGERRGQKRRRDRCLAEADWLYSHVEMVYLFSRLAYGKPINPGQKHTTLFPY